VSKLLQNLGGKVQAGARDSAIMIQIAFAVHFCDLLLRFTFAGQKEKSLKG
jgi:hypothetical protein